MKPKSTPKQKGGILLPYKNVEESEEIFRNFINNSALKIFSSGANGIILTGNLQNDIPKNYSIISPDENFSKPVKNIIIKLCIVSDDYIQIKLSNKLEIYTIIEQEFQDEINIQTDIYLKTIQYLQPLCPGIVYANITNDNSLLDILMNNSNENKDKMVLSNIKKNLSKINLKLGIIGMEIISNSYTLNYYKKNNLALNVGRYALLKLALETGYNHNDFHYGNILLENSNNYFAGIDVRPIVIDFGRSTKINPDIMSKIKNEVNNKNYTNALKYLCHYNAGNHYTKDPEYNSYYGWICGNYNLNDPVYFKELAQNILSMDPNSNIDSVKVKLRNSLTDVKELELYDNEFIEKLFLSREKAIDNNIIIMDKLHNNSPDQYPLLPISSNIKDKLFSGIIGGKKKEKNRKTRRYVKKYNKTKKRRI